MSTTPTTKKLVIIDGHALAFRTFHGMASAGLRTSHGEPTYAVYGFVNILLNMMQERQPDYLAIAFDIGRTFRHEMYAEYKAGRAKTPEEFHPQLDRIKQIITALGIPIYTAEGYEADDVIGTLAHQATRQDIETLILTGDTDTLQLVDSHVHVLLANPYSRSMESTLYTEEKVRERYKGLAPYQLVDLRGLKGDASDNIPGVKGIGETGAISLLNEFGTVEQLYASLDKIPNRYRKHLEGQKDQALFSKQLAAIVCDVPVTLNIQDTIQSYQRREVIQLFQELEFRSLVDKLPPDPTQQPDEDRSSPPTAPEQPTLIPSIGIGIGNRSSPDDAQMSMFGDADGYSAVMIRPLGDYTTVVTEDALQAMVTTLHTAPAFAFDTECTSLQPFLGELVGISLAIEPGKAWYIPVGHNEGEQLDKQYVLDTLRPLFADATIGKYAHHAKFDLEVLLHAGVAVQGLVFDTLLAAGLLDKPKSLKDLAFAELQLPEPMTGIEKLIGKGAKQRSFATVPIEHAAPYAAADADITLRLTLLLQPQVEEHPHVQRVFHEIELPLVPVLVAMEHAGIGLDVPYMRELSKRMRAKMQELEQEIYTLAGETFNINSSLQLQDVLFNSLGLPTDGVGKTAKGRYSLRAETLEKLRGTHDIIALILDYRHLAKLTSTYVDVLPTLVHPQTNRVHTSFNQLGTATGRLASSSPNLQNVPVRTELGNEIRRGFVAAPGCTFIAADYSQIELRILAHITQDPNMVQAFQEGQDIHTTMASYLFQQPLDAIDKYQRRIAKATVFGIIYGISSFGLAQRTDMTRQQAQTLIDSFFDQFPGVRDYIDRTLEQGRTSGYVESLAGRRRMMPDLKGSGARRQAAEREAINTPIQATAADMMKRAMIRVADTLTKHQLQARMVLQVHDELIFDTPREEVNEVQRVVRVAMEQVEQLRVPLKVDIEVGDNWEHMQEVIA
jgi:DNA polymerase-1